ncbi:MAG: phosphoribosylformylglycinamidine synthase subunit PurQ [Thermoplasmata archaeon]|nr:MAG: phosphoribosylformylglycinamidine synthase subunit PurQ [Thermoplasmata archaeon]RLF33543.1 MAG: phosphoribosylformylglycinamidine synthase subunit PurQ [Thermoplasmata archaeon]RLF52277.1 MAG: phosphoribosylformylglycinamidine synthase subunit PurQ [Thermoplasmata archaeon]
MRVGVLRIEGTNCEQESYDAFKRLGANPEFVHLKQLLHIDCDKDEKRDVFDYQCLMIPGGFSAGDYIRAGAIFAARIKSKLGKDLEEFVKQEYPILGVCNGFQVLTELGLLPGLDVVMKSIPDACLSINDSNRFECRPTLLKHENNGKCVFTRRIPKGDIRLIPSAHAEGKLLFPLDEQELYLKKLDENDQIVFRYVNPDGEYAGYPWNPNGSIFNIAGVCNYIGNVFGMMPHPERVFYRFQHPDWTRSEFSNNVGDGRAVFESVLDYVCKKF